MPKTLKEIEELSDNKLKRLREVNKLMKVHSDTVTKMGNKMENLHKEAMKLCDEIEKLADDGDKLVENES